MKIAINGFGRIGRTFLRTVLCDTNAQNKINVEVINCGSGDPQTIAFLFAHDSIMGKFEKEVKYEKGYLVINKKKIALIAQTDPLKIDWKKYNIDWVVESSGRFTKKEEASKHLKSGAKKVLITAPAQNEDVTIIPGVNYDSFEPKKHKIVSLGSCTTNAFVPSIKVIKDNFTLINGLMTTTHAYTNSQVLLDLEHKDPRRARAAAMNIVPTETGAEKAVIKIFPELEGKIFASALRIPLPIVSILDFTFVTKEKLTKELINKAFKKASQKDLKNIIYYTELPLVSSDYIGSPYSAVLDSQLTQATGNMGKIFCWYDNEWGYSERLKDFLLHNS